MICKSLRAGAWVVLILFAIAVMFAILVSCSSFTDHGKLSGGCDLECIDCKEVNMRCDTDFEQKDSGEEKGNTALGVLKG